ncbi:MAG: alpha/beta fold hydrolase [Chloroflexota bacterium]
MAQDAKAPGRYIRVRDLEMYYEEYGSGPLLILLHGGTSTSAEWQANIPAFTCHFRVIAPDSRGHGRTNNPAGELSYRQMADDIAALVQALGLPRPLILGYSDGGQVALELAMNYPGLAAGYVIGAAWYRFSDLYLNALQGFGLQSAEDIDLPYILATKQDAIRWWQSQHTWSDDPQYWNSLLCQITRMWWTPLDYTAEDFQKIGDPALVLIGDRDGIIDVEQALEMYQMIPGAELSILPNATHMTTTANPLFNSTVLDFLLRAQPMPG